MDLATAKPRQVEAYLREVVRKSFGDEIENAANIYARAGFYTVQFSLPSGEFHGFNNFRKKDAKRIAKAIRALKEN